MFDSLCPIISVWELWLAELSCRFSYLNMISKEESIIRGNYFSSLKILAERLFNRELRALTNW